MMSEKWYEIYQWSDGSTAEVLIRPRLDEVRIVVKAKWNGFGDKSIWFQPRLAQTIGKVSLWASESEQDHIMDIPEKIVGLALDLGVTPPSKSGVGLIHLIGVRRTCAQYPRWVSDDLWDRRHSIAMLVGEEGVEAGEGSEEAELLFGRGSGLDFELLSSEVPGSDYWVGKWTCDGRSSNTQLGKRNGLVDMALRDACIMPESAQSAWEEEHVDRGSFVASVSQELEVIRLLGGVLPFFWPIEELSVWLDERTK